MFELNKELYEKQFFVMMDFLYHYHFHKKIYSYKDKLEKAEYFWSLSSSNNFYFAFIDWCKVFGAYSEELHWRKQIKDKNTQAKFEEDLLIYLGINYDEWEKYHAHVRNIRNKHIAHSTGLEGEFPHLKNAEKSIEFYNMWISENALLDKDTGITYIHLRNQYNDYLKQMLQELESVLEFSSK
jgi:hypothetical protein